MARSASALGRWSALIAAASSLAFTVTGVLGLVGALRSPWNPVIPDAASFILAISFVVMMACLYESAPREARAWALSGLAIAILYAAAVSIVYMTIITFVTPSLERGGSALAAPFVFDVNGSFMQAVDGLGYFFQCLATLLAAPMFAAVAQRWLRRAFVANGVVGFFVLFSYMPLVFPSPLYPVIEGVAALWILTLPAAALLSAQYFRAAASAPSSAQAVVSAVRP